MCCARHVAHKRAVAQRRQAFCITSLEEAAVASTRHRRTHAAAARRARARPQPARAHTRPRSHLARRRCQTGRSRRAQHSAPPMPQGPLALPGPDVTIEGPPALAGAAAAKASQRPGCSHEPTPQHMNAGMQHHQPMTRPRAAVTQSPRTAPRNSHLKGLPPPQGSEPQQRQQGCARQRPPRERQLALEASWNRRRSHRQRAADAPPLPRTSRARRPPPYHVTRRAQHHRCLLRLRVARAPLAQPQRCPVFQRHHPPQRRSRCRRMKQGAWRPRHRRHRLQRAAR